MNDMNDDGPAQDSNPQPLAYQGNALPTELLGLAGLLYKTFVSNINQPAIAYNTNLTKHSDNAWRFD